MEAKDISADWAHIRKIAHTIPDDVLDFMKDAAIRELTGESVPKETLDMANLVISKLQEAYTLAHQRPLSIKANKPSDDWGF